MHRLLIISLAGFVAFMPLFLPVPRPSTFNSEFTPDRWSKQDLDRYFGNGPIQASAESSKAMVGTTAIPLTAHAGLEVLKHGGNAADAALTTALTQNALTVGAAFSYAGVMAAVYYDAASQKVYALN